MGIYIGDGGGGSLISSPHVILKGVYIGYERRVAYIGYGSRGVTDCKTSRRPNALSSNTRLV